MSRRKMLFIAAAVFLGFATLFMMRTALHHPQVASGTEVLVAASDIPSGTFLQTQNLRWQSWEPSHITEAFITHAPSSNAQELIGAVARQGIRAGEPILRGEVVKPQDRGFLSAVLDPGMRAVAAPITNVTGIAGFVFPGDRVDLILTHTMRAEAGDAVAQRRASVTVVKNVRVLALDQNTNDQNTAKPQVAKVVTLEVSPKQAEVVTLALQLGTLSLSLRSLASNDDKLAEPVGYEAGRYTLDSDVSHLIPSPKDHIDITNSVVRVLRGKERSQSNFQNESSASDTNNEAKPAATPE